MTDNQLIRQALLDAALADFTQFAPTIIPQKNLHSTPMTCVQQTILRSTTCHMHDGSSQPEDSDFSPQYLAWEKKFLRNPQAFAQRALRPLWKTALRSAACFLLVVSLSFSSLMAFSPQARAWVVSWFTEWYEDHVTYRFTGETLPTEALRDWTLGYLPEGYIQTDYIDLENMVIQLYNTDDPNMEIEFSYQLLTDGSEYSLDNEYHVPSPITVNGMTGKFLAAIDGSKNMMVWFDEDNHHAFFLMSYLPQDALIKIAENVVPEKE